ncbi:MAG: phosphoribosylamine--glycine ligase [Patescibacteria group bacterium]
MNILLVGNGAREHAIAEALKRSPQNIKLFTYLSSRNPGLISLSEKFEVGKYSELDKIVKFAQDNQINFSIMGPEAPLSTGVVDALEKAGIPSVGPYQELAQLETSKSFTRNLMKKYNIPGNPRYQVFKSTIGIKEFMQSLGGQFVVKADGLHGGKGVKVVGEHLQGIDDGFDYAVECIKEDGAVVVEEKFVGEEFSLQCLTDGVTVLATPPAQDHKRAYDGDQGPNTGGMGSYTDANHLLPFLKTEDVNVGLEITRQMAAAIKQETGKFYKGVMYGGFIVTKDGVRLIEYNARFGDPEAENIMPILASDLVEVCQRIISGTLGKIKLEFSEQATVCKYVVPEGYPDAPLKGEPIDLSSVPRNVKMYLGSVEEQNGQMIMTGSRAVAMVGVAGTLADAERIAQSGVAAVKGKIFYRKDIGTAALLQKRVDHIEELKS